MMKDERGKKLEQWQKAVDAVKAFHD